MFLRRNLGFDPGGLAAGRPVYSADGEKLGTVADIAGSYLRVDAPLRRDYWLSAQYVQRANGGVHMSFPKKDLDEYKLAEPGLEPEDDPMRGITKDAALITEDEQLQQRARMELELAEQRRQLPPEHEARTIGIPVEAELAVLDEEIGLPLEMAGAASSPTGAVVSAPRVVEPERARARIRSDGGPPPMDDDSRFAERWTFAEETPATGSGRLWIAVAVVAFAALVFAFARRKNQRGPS